MDTQLEAIQSLIRINRDAMRELAKVAETTSADYVHIDNAMRMLGEQFHILLQQKEEQESIAIATERKVMCKTHPPCVMPTAPNATENEKRGRGAEKQFFLKDESLKPAFLALLKALFMGHYTAGKTFKLQDGTEANAPDFLACLYDIGIKYGITSPKAPVYDFSCMLKEAAQACPNAGSFNTAYNTLQRSVRKWKPFTGDEARYYGINVRFHRLRSEDVPRLHKAAYDYWLRLYTQVEEIYIANNA